MATDVSKYNIKTKMKKIAIIFTINALALVKGSVHSDDILQANEDASQFLESNNGVRRDKALSDRDLMKKFNLQTPEKWSEYQEDFEAEARGSQEEDVELLEDCVRSCKNERWKRWKKNRWWEQKEDYDDCLELQNINSRVDCPAYPMPCPNCFKRIPLYLLNG